MSIGRVLCAMWSKAGKSDIVGSLTVSDQQLVEAHAPTWSAFADWQLLSPLWHRLVSPLETPPYVCDSTAEQNEDPHPCSGWTSGLVW